VAEAEDFKQKQNGKFGFVEEDAPRGTFAKVPLGTPQNFWKKF
jgi:hypothetical protein